LLIIATYVRNQDIKISSLKLLSQIKPNLAEMFMLDFRSVPKTKILYMTTQCTFLPSLVQICFVVSEKEDENVKFPMTRLSLTLDLMGISHFHLFFGNHKTDLNQIT
jgi:hypothetical protein